MKTYSAKDIRNVAIAGHSGKGKTTLAEAMLYLAKATERLGRVADGNTVLDFDAEEKRRKATIATAMAAFEWNNTKINLLDTPGLFDFAGGMSEGIRAAESVLIVLGSGSGVDVGAEKAFKAASDRGIAKMFAVTRCDAENTNFQTTLDSLKAEYGAAICPVVVPLTAGDKVTSYVDFATGKAYSYDGGKATEIAIPDDPALEEMKAAFTEAVASADEELMEKFFMEEPLTADDIAKGLKAGIASGDICPVFACSGYNTDAVELILNTIVSSAPDATAAAEGDCKVDESAPVAAICFKTVADPFVGKMSFFKVISGKLSADIPAYNSRTGEQEKMGKMLNLKGAKQEDVSVIPAGDIGVVTKLSGFKTGDTLCAPKSDIELKGVNYPTPCLSMAIRARKKGEEDKVAAGLNRIAEEDPTVAFESNVETHEQILSGIGEQHIDSVVTKLKNKFNVEVDLSVPKVAYRETISKTASVQGRHKKQSGGSGQFGDVWIRFEKLDGEDFEFAEEVVGGSVPKNFFPAVEKGLREAILKGPLAGYPVVGMKAVLYDGSSHPVDSNEMAFKTAAKIAFKNGMPLAGPKLLEPYGRLEAYMPGDNLGDIMGDVTKRRGRVLGMGQSEEDPKMQKLDAEVPMAEMGDFATVLRSVTIGRGYFTFVFDHYETAPENVAQKVIEEAKANAEEE
ncbi:MAG: elongation factor G [Clostridia bacterium]|nr:elongation factor G [Clostridia bacterium]